VTAVAVDAAIDALARRQHGVFSRDQAISVGATTRMIDGRLANGRWLRLAPAVYGLPSHPGTWHRAVMAAVLGEPDAVAGGPTAAVLHRVHGFRPGRLHLVVPATARAWSASAVVHRCSDYQRAVIDHIPVLSLRDTVFAVAASLDEGRLGRAVDELLAEGRLSVAELQERHLELAASRRPGLPRMRSVIEARSDEGYQPPESVLEELLYRVLDGPGMPVYERQPPLPWDATRRADARLVGLPVLIEADGRRWHTRLADFDRDRLRDREAARHGFTTLRYTARDLTESPGRVGEEVREVAGRAAGDRSGRPKSA
jgi:hypothetical protein